MTGRSPKTTRLVPARRTAPGTAPGAVAADPEAATPRIRVITFNETRFDERDIDSLPENIAAPADQITWIDAVIDHYLPLLEHIGDRIE